MMRSRHTRFALGVVASLVALTSRGQGQTAQAALTLADLAQATESALDGGQLAHHLDFVEKTVLDAVQSAQTLSTASKYDRVLNDEALSLALAQSALLRSVTSNDFARLLRKGGNGAPFLKWLLARRDPLESFLTALQPGDKPARILELWAALWAGDAAGRDEYASLALACALVFDEPVAVTPALGAPATVDMRERYDFFRGAAEKHRLKTDVSKLPPWELVWVVDAPVPDSELQWAQEHVGLDRVGWSKAYAMVRYRMDKATQGEAIHKKYTLEEIQRKGGTCLDQAYFATMTAKANGIPAMILYGEGQSGAHAWFAYKASAKTWNSSTGKYQSQRFATGYAIDPQTRQTIKEQTIYFLSDPQRRASEYDQASRLTWLAGIYLAQGQPQPAGAALEAAVARCSRHVPAWEAYLGGLKQANTPPAKWKAVLQTARREFRDYPDMLARLGAVETDALVDVGDVDQVLKSLKSQVRKLKADSEERTDLILENVRRHIKLLQDGGNTNAVAKVYEKSLDEFGDDLVVFKSLAGEYFDLARQTGATKRALDKIDAVYRRSASRPTGDFFAIEMQARLMDMMAGFYDADGQRNKADKLRDKAADMRKRAAAAHRWDR